MTDDLTYSFTVAQSPAEAFAAICDVRAWWSGDIEGRTDVFGAEWSYRVPDIHFSAFRITGLVPDRSVAWLVTDSWLSFTRTSRSGPAPRSASTSSPLPRGRRSGSRTTGWSRRSSATACAGSPGASTSSAR